MNLYYVICVLALISATHAAIVLPSHFSDGAILQTWRGNHVAAHLYGSAAPGELVTIACSAQDVPSFTALAGADGSWNLAYNWPPGPTDWDDFDLEFSGSMTPSPITLRGVRWGDVIMCIGDGSALLPISLATDGDAWLRDGHVANALKSARVFSVAAPGGSCGWGADAPPCDVWVNTSIAGIAPRVSAACVQTAIEATLAKGFSGNTALGVVVLAANTSHIEDWLPPAGVSAVAATCAPLGGGPASAGALWAAMGAPFYTFPPRYTILAHGGAGDADRLVSGSGGVASTADAYACRVGALIDSLRASVRVGDSPFLLMSAPNTASANADALWALRVSLTTLLPAGVHGRGAVTLVETVDVMSGVATNAGGASAPTNITTTAIRSGPQLAYAAWWAFDVAPQGAQGPIATTASLPRAGVVTVSFITPSNATTTLVLLPASGCTACCAQASASFQTSAARQGPWVDATATLAVSPAAVDISYTGTAVWVRYGAAQPAECLLYDAGTGKPAPVFLIEVGATSFFSPPAVTATSSHLSLHVPLELLAAAPHAPLAEGVAPRRAYLLDAARRARYAATHDTSSILGAKPQMYFNTWQSFRCNHDEWLLKRVGDVLVSSGLAALGYRSVNSDDCEWRTSRDAVTGAVVADETRYPHGMLAVTSYLAKLGLAAGVYTSATSSTCVGRPASYEHEAIDIVTWCAMGYTTVKVDNCGGTKYKAINESWVLLRAAMEKECPARQMLLAVESCGSPTGCATWIRNVGAQSWRTTDDLQLYWQSVVHNLDGNEPMAPFAGPGGYNDPDMLIIGHPALSPPEARSHMGGWVISAAPLGISWDITGGIDNDTLAILSAPELVAVNQDVAGIQGVRATPANATGSECWAKPLAAGGGNVSAVFLFNRASVVSDVSCAWADVLPHVISPNTAHARVRDLWARADVGVFEGGYTARALPPHGSEFVSVTPL